MSIWRKLLQGEEVTEKHEHLAIEQGKLIYPPCRSRIPALFRRLVGAGVAVAAEHVDVYLTWGEPPGDVAAKIATARALAAARGRTLSFGIRLHVIVRETSAEAWRAADCLISKLDDEAIAKAQKSFARLIRSGRSAWPRCTAGAATSLK